MNESNPGPSTLRLRGLFFGPFVGFLPVMALLAGAILTSGCQFPGGVGGTEAGEDFVYLVPGFDVRAPGDVAILPLSGPVFASPSVDPSWASRLRESLYRNLLRKGYAPLNPDFVDQELRAGEAWPQEGTEIDARRLADALSVDAFLLVRIDGLDLGTYQDSGKAVVRGELQLWDGASATQLWTTRRRLKLEPSPSRGSQQPEQGFGEAAIERFLATCLDQLPPR